MDCGPGRDVALVDSEDRVDDRAYDYTYDTNGNRETDERGDYDYNARDQLTHWDKTGTGSIAGPDREVTYRPAGDGRLLGTTETFSAPGAVSTTRTTTNTYLGERLDRATVATTASDGGSVPDGQRQIRYDYDIFGSLLTIKTAETAAPTPPVSAFDTSTQYTYDSFERLLSSRDDQDDDGEADGDHEVYCYDALDRRDRRVTGIDDVENDDPDSFEKQRTACRTPPTETATLDYSYLGLGEQLTRENTDTGKGPRTYDYTPDGMRLGQRAKATSTAAAKFRPYETDAQGSTIALEDPDRSESTPADEDGDPAPEPEDRYQLDPYGDTANETTLAPAAKDNPFRYQSHYLDAATGTYDMQARAYRPALGRFLSQDRFEDPTADLTLQQDPLTNNRYAFASGNPTTNTEDDGHISDAASNGGYDTKPGAGVRKRENRWAQKPAEQQLLEYNTSVAAVTNHPKPVQAAWGQTLRDFGNGKWLPGTTATGTYPPRTIASGSTRYAYDPETKTYRPPNVSLKQVREGRVPTHLLARGAGGYGAEDFPLGTTVIPPASCTGDCPAFAWTVVTSIGGGSGAVAGRLSAAIRARIATKAGPNRINAARVLRRSADEPGPYHNFRGSLDDTIFAGKRTVVSDNYVLYTKRGTFTKPGRYVETAPGQGTRPAEVIKGTYEIGVRPSASGRTEVITHRFFRPDQ